MAKSIIQIDVDDSKFLQFKSVFDDYKQSLESTPEAWSDANSEMGNMVQASQLLKNDAEKRLALLQSATLEEEKAEKALSKQEQARKKSTEDRKKKDLESIKRWKELGSTIAGATAQLAKFAAVGLGIATGTTTLGMGKLANDASAARFQSMGLGVSSGAMQSANVNYAKLLGSPTGTLQSIRESQTDVSQAWKFSTIGVQNAANKSTDQLLPEVLTKIRDTLKAAPASQRENIAKAYGMDGFTSAEDRQRMMSMSDAEFSAENKRYQQDLKNLALSDSTLKSYQDLNTQWERFKQKTENTFIKGLEPLAPALTRFSEAIGSAFEKFMAADKLKSIINKLADGITRFAEGDLNKFITGIETAAATLGTFAEWIGSITPEKAALVGGGVLAAGAAATGVGALAAGAASIALPLAAAGAGGAYIGSKAYENDTPENQEWTQKLVGNVAAFFGDKDAQDAQAQLKSFETNNKIAEEALKNGTTNNELSKEANARLKELGKPMSKDEYKKIDDESKSGFIVGIGQVFKTALSDVWGKTKEVAGDVGNAMIDSADAGELPSVKIGGNQFEKHSSASKALEQLGMKQFEARGLATNIMAESSMNPMIGGDGGKAYGLMQWHPDRQAKYTKLMGHTMQSVKDKKTALAEQLKFAHWEMTQDSYESKNFSRASKESGGNASKMAGLVSKYVERPKAVEEAARNRSAQGAGYEKQYGSSISKGSPVVTGRGEKDINGKVKDTYALRKPTADQQKSVMFQDQGGGYNSNSNRVQINVSNSTGGSATASAVSL
jgi:hypothetical protein